ncbi:hypothetical protein HMN09_00153900 [Mycena chlorophos]|uniref:Uncharacterized protein n=1 Tax=Mycena chlorophos TaxID=658473 RepID=A0A8H6WKF1_MYCCL|nr:hypothetical protein HMN09_00153900 [Mycena chlorophos]
MADNTHVQRHARSYSMSAAYSDSRSTSFRALPPIPVLQQLLPPNFDEELDVLSPDPEHGTTPITFAALPSSPLTPAVGPGDAEIPNILTRGIRLSASQSRLSPQAPPRAPPPTPASTRPPVDIGTTTATRRSSRRASTLAVPESVRERLRSSTPREPPALPLPPVPIRAVLHGAGAALARAMPSLTARE